MEVKNLRLYRNSWYQINKKKNGEKGGRTSGEINSETPAKSPSIPPPVLGPPFYSFARAGHAASRNTFLERLFIVLDFSDKWSRRARNAIRVQSASIQISGPRGPCFSSRGSRPSGPGSLIKTSIRAREDSKAVGTRKTAGKICIVCYERKRVISVPCIISIYPILSHIFYIASN